MLYGTDLAALAFVIAAFVAQRAYQSRRARLDPAATLQGMQAALRAQWVAEILQSRNGILGVQTLRNALMVSIFLASNTMFLVLGTLTLTAQERLAENWTLLDPSAVRSAPFAQAKLLLLLLILLVAFFCFVNALRLFLHASVRLGTSASDAEHLTSMIDAAWGYQGLGVRCYYFAVPALLWLFGTLWLVLSGFGMLVLMHRFDNPAARS
jgi:uncharacterized membrane protein